MVAFHHPIMFIIYIHYMCATIDLNDGSSPQIQCWCFRHLVISSQLFVLMIHDLKNQKCVTSSVRQFPQISNSR